MFRYGPKCKAALAALCLAMTSACSDELPVMTDDELVVLIGEMSFLRDRPFLPKRVVECVRLLGGLDHAIYKDLAEPLIGIARTECRKALDEKIKDVKRNPKGAKLAHFEDPAVGERVTLLHARLEEEDERHRREDQARRDAERKAKAEARIAALRTEVEALSNEIDGKLAAAEKDCREWDATRKTIIAENRFSIWQSRRRPELCAPTKRSQTRDGLVNARALLQDLRVEGDVLLFRIPPLGAGDPKRVASLFAALAQSLEELRKDASE